MAALAAIISIAGTALSVVGAVQQGKSQRAAAEYEAKQQERSGREALAASQRQAQEKRMQTDVQLSRVRAIAAGSGAGVENPSIVDIYSDTGA